MLLKVLLSSLLVAACVANNIVKDCGGDDAWIKFKTLSISPMPFDITGKINVQFEVVTTSQLGSAVKLSVKIKKSNLGGGFTWEVPCTNIGLVGSGPNSIQGFIGTCEYAGTCDFPFIKSWTTKGNCPSFFSKYGVPCTCPFPAQTVKTTSAEVVDLAQFQDRLPKWLIEGGYSVKILMKDTKQADKVVGCFEMNFEVKPKTVCPEVLRKLGAC